MTTQAVSGRRYFTKAWLLEQKSLIALLVLIAIVSTLSPNFFTVNNLFNILQQTSVNAIMAVGMTLVILTSGIDLSVGSLLALTGAVAASIVGVEVNALVAVAAALALGAAIGAVTGVIVAKGRVQALLAHQQRPQAVFTGNDAMAVGAYQALYQAGLRIPQDMAVIGYDDIELARYMTPPLTTIHQPKDELGELAIDVLIHRMAQPALQQQRLQLTPVLTVRGSV